MSDRASSPEQQAFASRLQAARRARGLSEAKLAALIGVPLLQYQAWENAGATPNKAETYREICRHLDVTMNWLFFGDTIALPTGLPERLDAALRTVDLSLARD